MDPRAIDFLPNKNIKKLLIVRLSAMGDIIHTMPAVQALRRAFPHVHLGWLVEERWAELLRAPGFSRLGPRSAERPLVDEVHTVNLKAWGNSLFSISALQRIATLWNDVRDANYDVAIDLQGAIRSALLARLSRARVIYGSAQPREAPASLWYTRKVQAEGRHVVEQNLSVAQAAIKAHANFGPAVVPNCIDFPRDPQSEERVAACLAEFGVHRFVILNPGAGWGAKRWPAARYGEVARGLAEFGLQSVLNYGPGEEPLVRTAETASGGAARAMKCTISELIALTRRAQLFVGGDTGPLHLAAALHVPVVGIYGPTDPARNGPYAAQSIVLRSADSVTSHARRAAADEGMLGITSDAVIASAKSLLAGRSLDD